MIDLILIAFLIISIVKPDVLLSKKVRAKATPEQQKILVKNMRISYVVFIALIETMAISRYLESPTILLIPILIEIFVVFKYSIPAAKENRSILKTL